MNALHNGLKLSGMQQKNKRAARKALDDGFPARLAEARNACGLSQARLAEMLDLESGQAVSNWERGANEPDVRLWSDLAGALLVSPEWLFYAKGEMAPRVGAGSKADIKSGNHEVEMFTTLLKMINKMDDRISALEDEVRTLRSAMTENTPHPIRGGRA